MNYILLTSCFRPILLDSVKNTNVHNNIISAFQTCRKYFNSPLCNHYDFKVVLIDCSDFSLIDSKNLFLIDTLCAQYKDLLFENITFSSNEVISIRSKGKGFSELLMLSKFLDLHEFPPDTIFLKNSARYTPLFPPTLFYPFSVDAINSFAYSKIAKTAICHSYLCSARFMKDFIDNCNPKLDDSSGLFLEKIIYNYILSCKTSNIHSVSRSLFYPFYNPKVLPGSNTARPLHSSILFQLLRNLVCFFF